MRSFSATVRAALALAAVSSVVGCRHTPGTMPQDMSATEHDAAAEHEDRVAVEHEAQHDPQATRTERQCTPSRGACWTVTTNPTEAHAKEAEHHREVAAKHRAASQALRDAEARSCAGLSADDRDTSPFDHTDDIGRVTPLRKHRAPGSSIAGAEVVFRAVPGMTAEWLQRLVDCHVARNAAIGNDVSSKEMPSCPLALPGVQAEVRSVGDGFAVSIRSDDDEIAEEILRRAEALQPATRGGPEQPAR